MDLTVKLQRVGDAPGFSLPAYMSPGASGMDLHAAIPEAIQLLPMGRILVPCGFSMELPLGWEAQIRPRSGLAIRQGITCLNTPGTIDSDYRGEIKVVLVNLGEAEVAIQPGDRIAQMVIQKVEQARLELVDQLSASERAAGGFGSTGKR